MSSDITDQEKNDRRVAEDIGKFGCHVVSVFDPQRQIPYFSYSIGIQETTGQPEAIIIGLDPKLGHSIINTYNRRIRDGDQFIPGIKYDGFLDGFPVYFESALSKNLNEYTLGCDRYYQGQVYNVVQIIWPSTSGTWPWEETASEWLKLNQPMLGRAYIKE